MGLGLYFVLWWVLNVLAQLAVPLLVVTLVVWPVLVVVEFRDHFGWLPRHLPRVHLHVHRAAPRAGRRHLRHRWV
jgi:hypothetical protein